MLQEHNAVLRSSARTALQALSQMITTYQVGAQNADRRSQGEQSAARKTRLSIKETNRFVGKFYDGALAAKESTTKLLKANQLQLGLMLLPAGIRRIPS